jgi:hypothetical protein
MHTALVLPIRAYLAMLWARSNVVLYPGMLPTAVTAVPIHRVLV